MTLTMREIGRCWKDVGEQRRGPVSLGINLATGSTNRLSPPISRQHTDSYLYCQVAAAAAPGEERRQFKEEAEADRDSCGTKNCDATGHIWGAIRGFQHGFCTRVTAAQMYAPFYCISCNNTQSKAAMKKSAAVQSRLTLTGVFIRCTCTIYCTHDAHHSFHVRTQPKY